MQVYWVSEREKDWMSIPLSFLDVNESNERKDVVEAYVCKTEVMWTSVLLIINLFGVTSTTDKGSLYIQRKVECLYMWNVYI